jgi:hypothetical protein
VTPVVISAEAEAVSGATSEAARSATTGASANSQIDWQQIRNHDNNKINNSPFLKSKIRQTAECAVAASSGFTLKAPFASFPRFSTSLEEGKFSFEFPISYDNLGNHKGDLFTIHSMLQSQIKRIRVEKVEHVEGTQNVRVQINSEGIKRRRKV